ncbi:hypothetical protein CRG98_007042 [Punica granatum]|uniref:Uncharacterized protein n=1 Tax=Punica granatum TaxID=22663 RepID=A0A2I0KW20_PUNGR|nr:hypothetical protein CRG98_007042 [Punica granatum]
MEIQFEIDIHEWISCCSNINGSKYQPGIDSQRTPTIRRTERDSSTGKLDSGRAGMKKITSNIVIVESSEFTSTRQLLDRIVNSETGNSIKPRRFYSGAGIPFNHPNVVVKRPTYTVQEVACRSSSFSLRSSTSSDFSLSQYCKALRGWKRPTQDWTGKAIF